MAAINALMTRESVVSQLVKRKNWAAREPGVVTVFCIVGVVGLGLITLIIYKAMQRRKASRASVV